MFRTLAAWTFLLLLCAAAASLRAQGQSTPPDDPKASELPEGDGKRILTTACTTCHGLEEVTKFRDYYTKDDWRDVVGTMVKYGAALKNGETEILVSYLGQYLSKR